jgi:hypothetical protein
MKDNLTLAGCWMSWILVLLTLYVSQWRTKKSQYYYNGVDSVSDLRNNHVSDGLAQV